MREGWTPLRLGDLIRLEYGKALPAKQRSGTGYPVFGSAGEVGRHSEFLVNGPGIVVGRKGTAGSVTWTDEAFFPIDTTYWVRILSGALDLRFAFLLLSASRLDGVTTQTGVPGLNRENAYRLEVSLPPIEEQRRIVDLMGHIDAMIHATTLSLDALRASREAALSDLIPLVPESGTPLSSVSTITDCEHKTAPTAKEHESVAGRVIGTPAIRDGRIISAEARPVSAATYSEWTGRRVPHQGDVVLTREAPVGQAALIREEHGPLCLGQRTVLLSPGSSYDSAFLLSLLMSPAYQRWLRGASVSQTVERINVKRLSEMPVPQLPVEAQRAVGAQLEAMLEAEDRGVDEIERLRALRAACLSALVTGSHEIPSAYDEFLSDEGWRDGVR